MAQITPSIVKGSLSLSVGGSTPVEVVSFDLPIEWTLDKSAFGWSASPSMNGFDATMKRIVAAIEEALDPSTSDSAEAGAIVADQGGGES